MPVVTRSAMKSPNPVTSPIPVTTNPTNSESATMDEAHPTMEEIRRSEEPYPEDSVGIETIRSWWLKKITNDAAKLDLIWQTLMELKEQSTNKSQTDVLAKRISVLEDKVGSINHQQKEIVTETEEPAPAEASQVETPAPVPPYRPPFGQSTFIERLSIGESSKAKNSMEGRWDKKKSENSNFEKQSHQTRKASSAENSFRPAITPHTMLGGQTLLGGQSQAEIGRVNNGTYQQFTVADYPMADHLPLRDKGLQEEIRRVLGETVGYGCTRPSRPHFSKPYPEIFEQTSFPRGYKIPNFPQFNGDRDQSTVEHIGRFTIMCGEYANEDVMKLKLFPNSLAGAAFTWYIGLPANSIMSWRQMEEAFHMQYYRPEREISMADLAQLKQLPEEAAESYIGRFKRLRSRCKVPLQESEFTRLALNGLTLELRKKFEGFEFRDLFELEDRVIRYERLLHEENDRKNPFYGAYYPEQNYDVHMAEIVAKKPVVCQALYRKNMELPSTNPYRKSEDLKSYTFDVTKAEEIFDYLLANGSLKLKDNYQIPSPEQLKNKSFCKCHGLPGHKTNECQLLRSMIQENIDKGALVFSERPKEVMAVDIEPFPPMAEISMMNADLRSLAHKQLSDREGVKQDREIPKANIWSRLGKPPKPSSWETARKEGWKMLHQSQKRTNNMVQNPRGQYFNGKQKVRPEDKNFRPIFYNKRSKGIADKVKDFQHGRSVYHDLKPKGVYAARGHKNVQEIQKQQRPKMVIPPNSTSNQWIRVEHKKFPTLPTRTQKRRLLRIKAQERILKEEASNTINHQTFERSADSSSEVISRTKTPVNIIFGSMPPIEINMVFVLPKRFQAITKEVTISRIGEDRTDYLMAGLDKPLEDITEGVSQKVMMCKPTASMVKHLKPLFIKAEINGRLISRVLVDNGACVNVLPFSMLSVIGRTEESLTPSDITVCGFSGGAVQSKGFLTTSITVGTSTKEHVFFVIETSATYNALLGRDWIHQNSCIPSSCHQLLVLWQEDKAEIVWADQKPFTNTTSNADAYLYDEQVGTLKVVKGMEETTEIPKVVCTLVDISRPIGITMPRPEKLLAGLFD